MTLEDAIRLMEILLAIAFLQQSAEHMQQGQRLFLPRLLLSMLLLFGIAPAWVCLALILHVLFILKRFHGPYNGGSDRMGLLILCCLCLACFLPLPWKEYAFGYLAMQLVLSYVIAGAVKIINPDWRSGRALQDVLLFSAYPASEDLRGWANAPSALQLASWSVILFELFFPIALLGPVTLAVGITIATLFHFANACLLGLNRFFWVWIAAYPSLVWLQQRIFVG